MIPIIIFQQTLQVIHVGSGEVKSVLKETDLAPFLGQWVHVNEQITYGELGNYRVDIKRVKVF